MSYLIYLSFYSYSFRVWGYEIGSRFKFWCYEIGSRFRVWGLWNRFKVQGWICWVIIFNSKSLNYVFELRDLMNVQIPCWLLQRRLTIPAYTSYYMYIRTSYVYYIYHLILLIITNTIHMIHMTMLSYGSHIWHIDLRVIMLYPWYWAIVLGWFLSLLIT